MNVDHVFDLVRAERLYPGLILHGSSAEHRSELAFRLARSLLCAEAVEDRPCGTCRHCARIADPAPGGKPAQEQRFHPDVVVIERDLAHSTSVEAIKSLVRTVQVSPFEARGQVFVIRSADSMTPAAANALLKSLEEPALTAPRHFLLLTPSPSELLPTLRSRCLSVYLGPTERLEIEDRDEVLDQLEGALDRFAQSGSSVYLMAIAGILAAAVPWEDARSGAPVVGAGGLVLDLAKRSDSVPRRRALLALAESILEAKEDRLRSISPLRILEAKVAGTIGAARRRAAAPGVAG